MRDLMGQKVRGKNGELEGSNECMSEKEMEIWWDRVREQNRVLENPKAVCVSSRPSTCLFPTLSNFLEQRDTARQMKAEVKGQSKGRRGGVSGKIRRWTGGDVRAGKWNALSLLSARGDKGKDLKRGYRHAECQTEGWHFFLPGDGRSNRLRWEALRSMHQIRIFCFNF